MKEARANLSGQFLLADVTASILLTDSVSTDQLAHQDNEF
jgi:hypothetical protein